MIENQEFIERLRRIETKIDLLIDAVKAENSREKLLSEWRSEKEIIALTGLSRNTLLKLRQAGLVTRSMISGKRNYYKLSDFKKILNNNQGKEDE